MCVFFFIYAVWSARSFAIHLSCRCFFLRWFRLNSVLDQCVRKPFVEWKCIWTCLTHSPKSENARRLCNVHTLRFCAVQCCAMLYVFFHCVFVLVQRVCNMQCKTIRCELDSRTVPCDWSPIVCDYIWYSLSLFLCRFVWEVRSLVWFIVYALRRFGTHTRRM